MITEEQLQAVGRGCGRHATPPIDERERQLWGLVEILSFRCYAHDDASISKGMAQEYLLAFKDELRAMTCDPPSYTEIFLGVLDFLNEGAQ